MKWMIVTVPVVVVMCLSSTALSQSCPEPIEVFTGSRLGQADAFGTQVRIANERLLVSAPLGNPINSYEEAIYIFELSTLEEVALITRPKGASRDYGLAVGFNGRTLIVGSPESDAPYTDTGLVYVYDISSEPTEPPQQIPQSTPGVVHHFGQSVALDSTLAVVGVPWQTVESQYEGVAQLIDLGTGEVIHELRPSDAGYYKFFGHGVDVDATNVLVTTKHDQAGLAIDSGAAYVFDAISGRERAKLLPDGRTVDDQFGRSYELHGSLVAIGAQWDSSMGARSGAVYIFDLDGNRIAKLHARDARSFGKFGASVAMNGATLFVGAPGNNEHGASSGAVYVFDLQSFEQIAKIIPQDGEAGDRFGAAVDVSGDIAVVGAPGFDGAASNSGKAYIYSSKFMPCIGDFNRDCVVDAADVYAFYEEFQMHSTPADLDGNGVYDYFDLSVFMSAFTSGCP
ncbi:MAG: hypothetical protein KDA29_01835 [Phycisphaerales bacterium]|nr:hypothetical protein [Phycisphaerales bacterium]